jgi:A/G-specific adenine glycosylase
VLCRVYDIADDPIEAAAERQLWQLATELVTVAPENAAGDLNEGLMELGALICTPSQPDCAACPIAGVCLAHARGVETERPVKQPRTRPPHYDAVAAIVPDEMSRYLLIQRPAAGLLGGLWGFPGGVLQEGEVIDEGFARTVREQIGVDVAPGDQIATIRHAYTHFRITLHACRCQIIAGEPQPLRCTAVRWVTTGELTGYPLPVTDAKIVQTLQISSLHAPALPLETTP